MGNATFTSCQINSKYELLKHSHKLPRRKLLAGFVQIAQMWFGKLEKCIIHKQKSGNESVIFTELHFNFKCFFNITVNFIFLLLISHSLKTNIWDGYRLYLWKLLLIWGEPGITPQLRPDRLANGVTCSGQSGQAMLWHYLKLFSSFLHYQEQNRWKLTYTHCYKKQALILWCYSVKKGVRAINIVIFHCLFYARLTMRCCDLCVWNETHLMFFTKYIKHCC